MADKKENDVAGNLVEAFQETNRAIAESFVAAQERNIKFAQDTFKGAMEVLKSHMESTSALMKELEKQVQKQQESFQKITPGTAGTSGTKLPYLDLFSAPLSIYKKLLEATETATEQGVENFQKAIENFQHTAKQGLDEMQKTTRHTHHTTKGSKES